MHTKWIDVLLWIEEVLVLRQPNASPVRMRAAYPAVPSRVEGQCCCHYNQRTVPMGRKILVKPN